MCNNRDDNSVKYRVRWPLAIAVAIWIGSMASGFAVWENFDHTPGATPNPTDTCTNAHPVAGWELTLYAHPRCQCTLASLTELATLSERAGPALHIRVVFFVPAEASDQWADGASRTAAGKMPHTAVVLDRGGAEIGRAGVKTSGTVVLRNDEGQIVFCGGLTRSRGQFGESAGKRAILDHLASNVTNVSKTPVYGCSLRDFD